MRQLIIRHRKLDWEKMTVIEPPVGQVGRRAKIIQINKLLPKLLPKFGVINVKTRKCP